MKWITALIKDSFTVNLLTVMVILLGIVGLTSMRRDLIPPLQFQKIVVNTSLSGATPSEVEKFVTYPIEESLKGLPGVTEMHSQSKTGLSQVYLEYDINYTDLESAVTQVQTRVDGIRNRLPEDVRSIHVQRLKVEDVFLVWLGLQGFERNNPSHHDLADQLESKIARLSGVIRVSHSCGDKELYIDISSKKLQDLELSIESVRQQIDAALGYLPIGETENGLDTELVEVYNPISRIEDLNRLPITMNRSGQSVLLSDIATLDYRPVKATSIAYLNGVVSESMSARKDVTSDAITLKAKLNEVLDEFNASLPEGLKAVNVVDGPQFIQTQIEVLKKNGLVGLVLVIITLVLFLGWRVAAMAAFGLPIAYFGALIVLAYIGVSIDLLSIIGMILVVGMLVDDAIIVSERYTANIQAGMKPIAAAETAVKDLIIPVTGTILTTLVAFAPLIFIRSEMSLWLFSVPLVVIVALGLSWLECFFVLPNHLAHFVKAAPKSLMTTPMKWLESKYEGLLHRLRPWRYLLMVSCAALIAGSLYLGAKKIPQNFGLHISSERISIELKLKESSSLAETKQKLVPIEEELLKLAPGKIENIRTELGEIWSRGQIIKDPRYAKIAVYLDRTYQYPQSLKKEVKPKVEAFLADFEDKDLFEKIRVEARLEDDNEIKRNMITVSVKGSEAVEFEVLEAAISKTLVDLNEVSEYVPLDERLKTTWRFVPDTEALVAHGLSPFQLASQMKSLFTPYQLRVVRLGGESVSINTQLSSSEKLSPETLGAYSVLNRHQVTVPLHLLGRWEKRTQMTEIKHEELERVQYMDFAVNEDSSNLMAAISAAQDALKGLETQFPKYKIEVVAADKSQEKSAAWAIKVAIACIVSVLFIIALVLKSVTQPFIVGLPIPFGLVGILLALYFHNLPMGLMALIGLVGTVGMGVNASIVMVDQINKLNKASGWLSPEAIITGSSSRLRAILLTTLTTLGGVFPMAYAFGGESGFTQPLAFSLAWGLSSSTILTLFLLPSLLFIRNDVLQLASRVTSKFKKSDQHILVPAHHDGPSSKKDQSDDDLNLTPSRVTRKGAPPSGNTSKPEQPFLH